MILEIVINRIKKLRHASFINYITYTKRTASTISTLDYISAQPLSCGTGVLSTTCNEESFISEGIMSSII